MKIKLNKEQVSFINGLNTPEDKQEFLINCFLHQCEEQLKYDAKKTTTDCDEPNKFTEKNYINDRSIASELAILSTKPKSNIQYTAPIDEENLQKMKDAIEPYGYDRIHHSVKSYAMGQLSHKAPEWAKTCKIVSKKGLLHFDLPKESGREKFDKFIEDNGLKKFTPPESSKELTKTTFQSAMDDFLSSDRIIKFGWTAVGTNEIPKGEINLDAFPATDKFFKDVEWASKFYDSKLLQEWINYQPPHPDKVKKYTKEDLISFHNKSRAKDFNGRFKYKSFDEIFEKLFEN